MKHELLPREEQNNELNLHEFMGRLLLANLNNGELNNVQDQFVPRPAIGGTAPRPVGLHVPTLPNPITGQEIASLPSTTNYLESVFARLGYKPDTLRQLAGVVDRVPQRNVGGHILYLVTAGLSVQLVTGYSRPHKDVDLVLLHPDVNEHQTVFNRTDNVLSHNFWGGINLEPQFLAGTAFNAATSIGDVLCAHPSITMVQKTSDAWGRKPREHDIYDATALAYWILKQPSDRQQRDVDIANSALQALTSPRERTQTADRLNTMFKKYPAIVNKWLESLQPTRREGAKLRFRLNPAFA